MSLGKWVKNLIVGAAAMGAVETGMKKEAMAGEKDAPSNREKAAAVEKISGPEELFRTAREAVVDGLNGTTYDETSGGALEGKGWKAAVKREGGKLFAVITVEVGGKTITQTHELTETENPDPDAEKEKIYSFTNDVDDDTARIEKEAREVVDAALDRKGRHIAINEDEE